MPQNNKRERPADSTTSSNEPPAKRLRCDENLDEDDGSNDGPSTAQPARQQQQQQAVCPSPSVNASTPRRTPVLTTPRRAVGFDILKVGHADTEAVPGQHDRENGAVDHHLLVVTLDGATTDDATPEPAAFDTLAPPTPFYWQIMLHNERRNRIVDETLIWRVQEGLLIPSFRDITIDWMSLVCSDFGFSQLTLFHAVQLMDKYLTLVRVPRDTLQLVALACVWIACKFNETTTSVSHPCTSADLLRTCLNSFSLDALISKELHVLQTLRFDVLLYGPCHFLDVYLFDLVQKDFVSPEFASQLQILTAFFLEITLYTTSFFHFSSVSRAYAALSVALSLTAPELVPRLPGLQTERVGQCRARIETMWQTISANFQRNTSKCPSLFTKFDCRLNERDSLFYPRL